MSKAETLAYDLEAEDFIHEVADKAAACAERDARIAELTRELEEARKDAELLDYIQTNGATVEIIPGAPDFYPVHFRVGGRYRTANESIRAAIRAAIKENRK